MKYLITDPCYIINDDEWQILGKKHEWGDDFVRNIKLGSKGEVIKEANPTTYGDGSLATDYGTIGVDAGLVCLAEVPDDYSKPRWGAVVSEYPEAKKIYSKAQTI